MNNVLALKQIHFVHWHFLQLPSDSKSSFPLKFKRDSLSRLSQLERTRETRRTSWCWCETDLVTGFCSESCVRPAILLGSNLQLFALFRLCFKFSFLNISGLVESRTSESEVLTCQSKQKSPVGILADTLHIGFRILLESFKRSEKLAIYFSTFLINFVLNHSEVMWPEIWPFMESWARMIRFLSQAALKLIFIGIALIATVTKRLSGSVVLSPHYWASSHRLLAISSRPVMTQPWVKRPILAEYSGRSQGTLLIRVSSLLRSSIRRCPLTVGTYRGALSKSIKAANFQNLQSLIWSKFLMKLSLLI